MSNPYVPNFAVKLEKDLNQSWEEYMQSNDWGSGDDRIKITQEIEKEYYIDQMFQLGMSDNEIEQFLEYMGF